MFGCYRKADANDPDTYVAAVAAILAEYDSEIIRIVTDPRQGIARESKWMPNIAELDEFCKSKKDLIACEKIAIAKGWGWDGTRWIEPRGAA